MALRFCLVGLVVALGFELPRGADVSACVRSGWNWVFADEEASSIRVASAPAASPTSADAEFAGIVDRMAHSFAADLIVLDRPEIEAEQWSFEPLKATQPAVATSTGRLDRLASAVELTRRAASAWADLFASVEASASLPGGSSETEQEGAEVPSTGESAQQPVTR
jgi:hypothetical protein